MLREREKKPLNTVCIYVESNNIDKCSQLCAFHFRYITAWDKIQNFLLHNTV